MSSSLTTKPVTVKWVAAQKGRQKFTMLTAYDYPTSVLLDETGVDLLLVGDSVATVLFGEPNTLSVTMDDLLRHTRAVTRGAKRAMVIGDMPFMSYQVSAEQALINAGRFLKEGLAQGVKLEGGKEMAEPVRAITRAGIPVMGHIGLTPQSIHALGSYRTHGKTETEQTYLLESAHELAEAGAFALVLECVEESLAARITQEIKIPTIGIGSGPACDGQVLVTHDLVGLTAGRVPQFVKPLAALKIPFQHAVSEFIQRTKSLPIVNPNIQPELPSPGLVRDLPLTPSEPKDVSSH
ncbi:MAG: 3-methyl-2-oxobutanoate hydroxymethyltransferase [Bdellovibrionia bacterium]